MEVTKPIMPQRHSHKAPQPLTEAEKAAQHHEWVQRMKEYLAVSPGTGMPIPPMENR